MIRVMLLVLVSLAASAETTDLKLVGSGVRHVRFTFLKIDVFEASLYSKNMPKKMEDLFVTENEYRLDFKFKRDIDSSDVKKSWITQFEEHSTHDYPQRAEDVSKLVNSFGEIKENGVQSLVFRQDKTYVYENNVLKGVITGDNFKKAVTTIFLGSNPAQEDLREKLMGIN